MCCVFNVRISSFEYLGLLLFRNLYVASGVDVASSSVQIAEQGKHEELLSLRGIYWHLVQKQYGAGADLQKRYGAADLPSVPPCSPAAAATPVSAKPASATSPDSVGIVNPDGRSSSSSSVDLALEERQEEEEEYGGCSDSEQENLALLRSATAGITITAPRRTVLPGTSALQLLDNDDDDSRLVAEADMGRTEPHLAHSP